MNPLWRLSLVFVLCNAPAPTLAQGNTPTASAAPVAPMARRSDMNDFRRQADPEKYEHQALSRNLACLLLQRVDVQREIRLTGKQKTQITPLLIGDSNGALDQEALNKVSETLSARQMQRLQQLDYQWHGPFLLFIGPDITKRLDFTQPQSQELSSIYNEMLTSYGEGGRGFHKIVQVYDAQYPPQQGPMPPEAKARMQQEVAALRVKLSQQQAVDILKAENQILALFSPAQKTQWKELLGKTFVFQAQSAE